MISLTALCQYYIFCFPKSINVNIDICQYANEGRQIRAGSPFNAVSNLLVCHMYVKSQCLYGKKYTNTVYIRRA